MPTEFHLIHSPETHNEQAQFWRKHVDGCEDITQHMLLKRALSDHTWVAFFLAVGTIVGQTINHLDGELAKYEHRRRRRHCQFGAHRPSCHRQYH
jgi:hypothetical protein